MVMLRQHMCPLLVNLKKKQRNFKKRKYKPRYFVAFSLRTVNEVHM